MLNLLYEDLSFLAIATAFLVGVGWAWRSVKPYELSGSVLRLVMMYNTGSFSKSMNLETLMALISVVYPHCQRDESVVKNGKSTFY